MNQAVCTVYRTFFRYARQLQAAVQNLDIRSPLDKEAWEYTNHSWVVNDPCMPALSTVLTAFSCAFELCQCAL